MENTEIAQPLESTESAESSASRQALEDATYAPGSYVEQNADVGVSEQVETTIISVVESVTQPAGQADLQSSRVISEIDPTTGEKTISDGKSTSEKSDQGPDEVVYEEETTPGVQIVGDRELKHKDKSVPPWQEDGARKEWEKPNELAEGDADPNKGPQAIAASAVTGSSDLTSNDSTDPEYPQLERELPEAMHNAIGMGKDDLIQKGVNTSSGKGPGSKTSGGGPPVGPYGPGWVGKGKKGATTKGFAEDSDGGFTKVDSKTSKSCSAAVGNAEAGAGIDSKTGGNGAVVVECNNGTKWGVEWNKDGYTVWKISYTVDGDQPTPYTGSGTGHHEPIPHGPETGPDREANFLRMLAGGKTSPKKNIGYGSSGSSTFSPDGGGEADDAGKYHGGLAGSAVRPNNPDDPDYYTPHELQEALKANIQTQASSKKET